MTTTIQKWGNSHGVRLPRALLDSVNWSVNEKISLEVQDGKLILARVQEKKSIEELFEGFEGEYKAEELDWGAPVGEEVW